MFGGRFSLTRFSLNTAIDFDARVDVIFIETLNSIVLSSQNTAVESNYRNHINSNSMLTCGIKTGYIFNEEITASAIVTAAAVLVNDFTENINAQIYPANNVNAITVFTENINKDIFLGYNYNFEQIFRENFTSVNLLAINVPSNSDFREAIFVVTTANELDSDSMVIDVRIPRGGTLIIDSENFIVTLNGTNIIHLHDGDFINISRNVVDMLIASGGQLNGELMYIERFL